MNRRRALLLCGLHRKRRVLWQIGARASRYAAAGAADAAGLRLFEAGRAKPSAAGAKRTAQQVRAYGAGTAKNDLRLRIGKRILSDTERITAKSSGKAAAKAAKGLRCTVRAGQVFSPTLQSRVHPHLFAQKLLRAAVLTQKSGAYAAAQSSRMRPAAAEHRARAPYRGHAYAQKLLRPAILAQKTKHSAFARASQPAPAAVRHTVHGIKYAAPYAQKLLRPAALAQRTKARNALRAQAAADAACRAPAQAFPFLLSRQENACRRRSAAKLCFLQPPRERTPHPHGRKAWGKAAMPQGQTKRPRAPQVREKRRTAYAAPPSIHRKKHLPPAVRARGKQAARCSRKPCARLRLPFAPPRDPPPAARRSRAAGAPGKPPFSRTAP